MSPFRRVALWVALAVLAPPALASLLLLAAVAVVFCAPHMLGELYRRARCRYRFWFPKVRVPPDGEPLTGAEGLRWAVLVRDWKHETAPEPAYDERRRP